MGIYRRGNIFWMSKTINGILYRKSTETESKMRARAIYEEWTTQLKESVRTGKPVVTTVKTEPKPAMTFSELADKYLEFTAKRLKSHSRLKSFIKNLINRFGDKPLDDFSLEDIEDIQGDILKKGQSAAYANRLVVITKIMFNRALDWELVSEDVIKRLKKCKLLRGEIKRLRYLSEEEAEKLLFNCEPHLKPFVITALNTGMRKSEILGLTWDRIDLKNRIILLDKTKNGERRELPVNDTLYQTLSGLTRHLKTDYVFYNPQTLKPYHDFKKPFLKALSKSHILDFHFHDLRHTFASWLVMKGADLTTVKELLGHKDIKMTLRYAHLAPAHIKKAVGMLDKKISSADLKIHKKFTMEVNKKI
ncbi:MAG: site-specific integrase [Candidatus Acididesulfobacter diazotrophicus]|jgi:integrase|uniref:Site-specific integrase n=1 Tax=Candidatus Acididesulfobacter diazotrophicus TaxID=2597226 RepID=A0A519BNY3_9DELT|nr:MAG: site-specific integrase [Candidatus Acididesulfobacter diazotrophicus]